MSIKLIQKVVDGDNHVKIYFNDEIEQYICRLYRLAIFPILEGATDSLEDAINISKQMIKGCNPWQTNQK